MRSGGAVGCDTAFELGSTNKEIYLPWKGFNGRESIYNYPTKDAYVIAKAFHPTYSDLSEGGKALMARNSHQILGYDLCTPSRFVICWTLDGCQHHLMRTKNTGGTGQAISIATLNFIPVFNLQHHSALNRLSDFIGFDLRHITKG